MISNRFCRGVPGFITTLCLSLAVTTVHAHLMIEQHGTVNFANGGAFLVLSVPVSAFDGIDDNGDGALSAKELRLHTAEVERRIHEGVQLLDNAGDPLPLQGLLLSPVPPDHAPTAPARQLVALGRFPVDEALSSPRLRINLQGEAREVHARFPNEGHMK